MKQRLGKRCGAVSHDSSVDPHSQLPPLPATHTDEDELAAPAAAEDAATHAAAAVFLPAVRVADPSPALLPTPAPRRGCLHAARIAARAVWHFARQSCGNGIRVCRRSLSFLLSFKARRSAPAPHKRSLPAISSHDSRRRVCRRARLRLLRHCLVTLAIVLLLTLGVDMLLVLALRVLHLSPDAGADSGEQIRAMTLVGNARVPWLACDCAGGSALGDMDDFSLEEQQRVQHDLQHARRTMDLSCGLCVSAHTAPCGSVLSATSGCSTVAQNASDAEVLFASTSLIQRRQAAWGSVHSVVSAVISSCFPGVMALYEVLLASYADHVEAVAQLHLQNEQNRGVEGHPPSFPSRTAFMLSHLRAVLGAGVAPASRLSDVHLVDGEGDAARLACEERSPLSRVSPPRHALPWLEVRAARVASGKGDDGGNGEKRQVDITVAATSRDSGFRSYVCSSDMPNISHSGADFVVDAARLALLENAERRTGAEAEKRNVNAAASSFRCGGCVFQCVHPRLLRRARGVPVPAAAAAVGTINTTDYKSANGVSWDVALEDVDAGRVVIPGSENAPEVVVTRSDLFTCAVLHPTAGASGDGGANRALLLSTDAWLSHVGGAVPYFFVNHSHGVSAEASVVPTRLLPLHTAAVYGESLQSFPDYALRMAHWLQFDAVYLPHRIRHPQQTLLEPPATAHEVSATTFSTWTVAHHFLRNFQLLVYLNQQLRRVQRAHPQRTYLTAEDLADTAHRTSGFIARLAVEVLRGADPMLLPLLSKRATGKERREDGGRQLFWRPPTLDDWGGNITTTTTTAATGSSVHRRLPAVVAAISHCWHGRLWWLSELSRYYPVHNYGRCKIPAPLPLPGDVPEAQTGSPPIPRRARYAVPPSCAAKHLKHQHLVALRSAPRAMTHLARDYELRCIFRSYRYVLAFENSIEDDYVTEKVYNALLSGALPLYVGAMNVDEYVPHRRVNDTDPFSAPGLSVVPALQLFPLLNETATRLEDRRIFSLHDADEASGSRVWRAHASALRTRAAHARRATPRARNATEPTCLSAVGIEAPACMADVVAAAMEDVAAQATAARHILLYSNDVPAEKNTDNYTTTTTTTNNNTTAASGHARQAFSRPAGTWPSKEKVRLERGFDKYLRRVHHAVAAPRTAKHPKHPPDTATPRSNVSDRQGRRRASAAAVRDRPQRGVALTANTAFGFAEEVAAQRRRQTTATAAARTADHRTRAEKAPSRLPDRIESFADEEEHNANTTMYDDTPTIAQQQRQQRRRGNAFSRFFLRRSFPAAEKFYTAAGMTTAEGPPMNGFAQLAAFLRTLDADPHLVAEAGYFDWWAAEQLEEFGASFVAKLHVPHPICGICATALEKKERSREMQKKA